MARSLALVGIWILVGVCCAGSVLAQSEPGTGSPEEIQPLLQEWEAAGLPPSAEEQARWLEALQAARQPGPASPHRLLAGRVSWRGYFGGSELKKWDGRLEIRAGPARMKTRLGRDIYGTEILGGALECHIRSGKAVVGYLGLEMGAGLLVAGPGRGGTLAADGFLGRVRSRLAPWTGIQTKRTVLGLGGAMRFHSFSLEAMAGRLCLSTGGASAAVQAVTLAWLTPETRLAVSGLFAATGQGLSLWGRGKNSFLEWAGEVAHWQSRVAAQPTISWQAVVSCTPVRSCSLQMGLAQAGAGSRSPLAIRSPLVKGADGCGWAFRSTWKSSAGLRLYWLATESNWRTTSGEPRRDQVRTCDVMVRQRAAPAVHLSVRVRATTRKRWLWSDRYRWQPAVQIPQGNRFQGQMRLSWQAAPGRSAGLTGIFLQQGSSGESSLRSLVGLTVSWKWANGVQVRTGYGAAWGDPLDLVTAVSPLPGLVLPRHWGTWQSETYAGLGLNRGGWKLQGAISVRRAPFDGDGQDQILYWLEWGWSW